MVVEVQKEDIRYIGSTAFDMGGYTAIVCDVSTCCVERILLRSILKCFGSEISIIDTEDDWNEDGTHIESITYITNLPYETFLQVFE